MPMVICVIITMVLLCAFLALADSAAVFLRDPLMWPTSEAYPLGMHLLAIFAGGGQLHLVPGDGLGAGRSMLQSSPMGASL